MITLKKSSLQDYQKLTQYIQKNTLLPVLSFLKLEQVQGQHQLTKSNNNSICIASIDGSTDAPYEPLLLDERILFGFLAESIGETITIKTNKTIVRISDGQTEVDFAKEDASNFPRIPVSDSEDEFTFTKDILSVIAVARTFTNDSETAGNFQFVHIGGDYISAINHHSLFINNRFNDMPVLILSREQADVISASDVELTFSASDNHYFFNNGSFQLIFTVKEGQAFDKADMMFNRMALPGKEFTIIKNDLTSFCNVANMVAETPVSLCSLSKIDKAARLKMLDNSYNRSGTRDVPVTGNFDEFVFNARLISTPLKVIPKDILECKTLQNNLIIAGDKEFYCFVGMQKPE